MISKEPIISVGVFERVKETNGTFNGLFELPNSVRLRDRFRIINSDGRLVLFDNEHVEVIRAAEIRCQPLHNASCTLESVTIGVDFHWERKESQTFEGNFLFLAHRDGTITAINEISVEWYLKSVISSEMSAHTPLEMLKAQAIASRSWLVAMLERKKKHIDVGETSRDPEESMNEIIRWYDREDHQFFDVCADDHCQRYQGITKVISKGAEEAIKETVGLFLVFKDEICDTRFSKSCGGRTELFENCWGDSPVPYLQSISDSAQTYPLVTNEQDAESWILSSPDASCNTSDKRILSQILPSFDQETTDFYRWKVEYSRQELEEVLCAKSGIDFGTVIDIVPLRRGPSSRIYNLRIVGTKRAVTVGKELEIRRWLSKTHLYSSAFIVKTVRDVHDIPVKFSIYGAGWGHGVGLCQIGAAVMAIKGFKAEEIVKHYFHNVELKKLY